MTINEKNTSEWPEDKIEHIGRCSFCDSKKRNLAYTNIQDWSFYASNGNWSYWDCDNCRSLYLDPRPKELFIHEAYENYYTHAKPQLSTIDRLKVKLKNEFFSHLFGISLVPRVGLTKKLSFLVNLLSAFLFVPFGLKQIVHLPKGKILDVGCGNGYMLKIAKDLGWNVTGIEIDHEAVKASRALGLNVIQGGYQQLSNLNDTYDCIICSHVLEHVYNPIEMLELLQERLNSGGTLLLSCPNSLSHMRHTFGADWRGIEAPRHISIPSLPFIVDYLKKNNFHSIEKNEIYYGTYIESYRIKRREKSINLRTFTFIKLKLLFAKKSNPVNSDYIQISAKK